MKKIEKIEEQKTQMLHQFLERLNREIPKHNEAKLEDTCVNQYKLLVNMSFSANILYKGLDFAGKLYNHVVKIEYKRLCKVIINQNYEPQLAEDLLKKLKKAQKELLQQSPLIKKSVGIDIFYNFTGGNRKKYQSNRKAIKKIYFEIKTESEKSFRRYVKDSFQRRRKRIKERRSYALWVLKSYTWR
ncbi:hypothetical protein GIX45_08485 [Erwinia sp. CPCC 100877]|nr:hypothetical protein [Erwinia sp. CPCC 100877]